MKVTVTIESNPPLTEYHLTVDSDARPQSKHDCPNLADLRKSVLDVVDNIHEFVEPEVVPAKSIQPPPPLKVPVTETETKADAKEETK